MSATARELVLQALEFRDPVRVPRDMWILPIAPMHQPDAVESLLREFPPDLGAVSGHERPSPLVRGDPHEFGVSTDAWGCAFVNIQRGVHGEVKDPLVRDWAADRDRIRFPREWFSIDAEAIARACEADDRFKMSGCCPRPFERLQFLRGSAPLLMDLADPPRELLAFMRELHAFYCELLEAWAATPVDALSFMDDWGTQRALFVSPVTWRELFGPMYRDYADIAHGAGKKIFMHSDGHILEIYPDLVDIGIDAVNSQIFCMGVEALRPFAGRITFWGEIDRQHLLARGTLEEIDEAVDSVAATLWRGGGCIAQCEFGAGARPANVRRVFERWDTIAPSTLS